MASDIKLVFHSSTHISCSTIFFFEKYADYEIMWKNIVEWGRSRTTIWRMRIERWVPKATYAHSEHVILIAFPLQQWLHGRASKLRYTFTVCHVTILAAFLLLYILPA